MINYGIQCCSSVFHQAGDWFSGGWWQAINSRPSLWWCSWWPFLSLPQKETSTISQGVRWRTSSRQMSSTSIFSEQVRELKEEKNQSILVSVFRALTGSRHRTRRRQMTGIPLTPVILESTPASHPIVGAATMQPTPKQEGMEQDESTPDQLDPTSIVEVVRQPSVDNQLGESYIMET